MAQKAEDVGCKNSWAVGETAWFEYHCWRSHESNDAELWYRSHRQVSVTAAGEDLYSPDPELDDIFKRGEAGQPRAYNIRFADGFEGSATEDELMIDGKFLSPEMGPPSKDEIAMGRAAAAGKAAVPAFDPKIEPDAADGSVFYTDGRMRGAVDVWENEAGKGITIHEWSSEFPGRGHSEQALCWLRERFATIVANGVGSVDEGVGDAATMYWQHMRSKGLADVLLLDDGNELAPESVGPKP